MPSKYFPIRYYFGVEKIIGNGGKQCPLGMEWDV
jgi:hypothetical protein